MMWLLLACGPATHSFDGVDDYVALPTLTGVDGPALTLEALIFPEAPTAQKANLLARRDPHGDTFTFRIRWDLGGVLEMGIGKGGREWGMAGHTSIPQGKWSFVAMTHDRQSGWVRLYVDGRLDAAQQANVAPDLGEKPTWMGGDPRFGPTGRPFHGKIKAARIFSTLRTEAELQADQQNPPGRGTLGLVWAQ